DVRINAPEFLWHFKPRHRCRRSGVDNAAVAPYLRPANSSAPVAELADAHGSGPCSERSGGSTPLGRTIRQTKAWRTDPIAIGTPAAINCRRPVLIEIESGLGGRAEPLGKTLGGASPCSTGRACGLLGSRACA